MTEPGSGDAAGGDWLDPAFVCLQAELAHLPPLPRRPAPDVLEMDMRDPRQIEQYLEVHNSAFRFPWGVAEYEASILDHPTKRVTGTYLLLSEGRAIGAASIGVFRRNPGMGHGHFLAIRKEYQGRGLGRWLVLYRFQRLAERGLRGVEVETRLRYRESILLHFGCGFRPKPVADEWNTPSDEPPDLTLAARRRLDGMFAGRESLREERR